MDNPEIAVKTLQPIRYDGWIDDGHSIEMIFTPFRPRQS